MQVFKFTNRGGDAGFRFFGENEKEEENDPHGEGLLNVGNFEIYPSEFYMQSGETQELVVNFTPQGEGIETKRVVLACDNLTSAIYTLKGSGNMAEISIHGIDALRMADFNGGTETMSRIFFEHAVPRVLKTRKLLLKNETDVMVKYHWNLFQQNNQNANHNSIVFDKKEDYSFSIKPMEGFFQPQ